ncbi:MULTISPECIES: FKBP-type peptidyl-prolyl cis-trans isomerase [unclassified Iodidimonas]|uniref:FKBP-type peptidyl-prolyl cis-trans isomerase n=1 Tax=unclassified Iodidimonas TaxID=2626145 RepID=UPI00248240DD|nr:MULTISPECIES: FKBP-type peptidyl-prolyl cis-trans isomerase [unclassified Iodidimonas]
MTGLSRRHMLPGLALLAVFSLAACGQGDEESTQNVNEQTTDAAETDMTGDQAAPSLETLQKTMAEWRQSQIAFLEDYAKGEAVSQSPSGVLYKVLEDGDGPSPVSGDIVTVHYEGKLIDGSVFDSSYQRGAPATFPSDRLIRGWVEILPMMDVGDKWEIAIPSDLAYGASGAGERIPPNSTLVFILELLDVESRS